MAHIKTLTRASGKTAYEVRWRDDTKHQQRTFNVKREAERFALTVENDLAQGASTAPLVKNSKTFRQVAEGCLEADKSHLKAKTLDGYEIAFRVHIYPVFGTRRIASITSQDVEKFISHMRAKPTPSGALRSETSVLGVYRAVVKIFTSATKHRLIPNNPCAVVTKPKASTKEANFLSVPEVEAIARLLDDEAPYGLLVRLAAFTGLRAGEIAALRIKDLDLLHGEVRAHRNMSHTSKGYVVSTPKTTHSRREVPILVDSLLADLEAYLEEHPLRADPNASLWPGKIKGHPVLTYERPYDPKGFYRYTFKPAAAKAGLPDLKFHELRHTFATIALESGETIFEVSRWLGHSSVDITDKVYAHLRKKNHSDRRKRFSAYVSSAG